MNSAPSYQRLLLAGVATQIVAADIGAAWDEFGQGVAYTRDDRFPIFIGPDMPSSPDSLIVLTPGVVSRVRADITTSVQIRLRGSARDTMLEVSDVAEAIEDIFYPNGFPRSSFQMGGIGIGAALPGDRLPFSPDALGRHGYAQNIRFRGRRTAAGAVPIDTGFGGGGFGG